MADDTPGPSLSVKQGWWALLAFMAAMAGLMVADINTLTNWSEALQPKFAAQFLAHFAVVGGAFAAGRQMPSFGDKS